NVAAGPRANGQPQVWHSASSLCDAMRIVPERNGTSLRPLLKNKTIVSDRDKIWSYFVLVLVLVVDFLLFRGRERERGRRLRLRKCHLCRSAFYFPSPSSFSARSRAASASLCLPCSISGPTSCMIAAMGAGSPPPLTSFSTPRRTRSDFAMSRFCNSSIGARSSPCVLRKAASFVC